jgi:predicted HicB family RNase H-like nuclease
MRKLTRQLQVRFPEDVKDWIKAEAEKNGSSQNSEIIRAVRDRMARVDDQQPA